MSTIIALLEWEQKSQKEVRKKSNNVNVNTERNDEPQFSLHPSLEVQHVAYLAYWTEAPEGVAKYHSARTAQWIHIRGEPPIHRPPHEPGHHSAVAGTSPPS